MKKIILLIVVAVLLLNGCKQSDKPAKTNNPDTSNTYQGVYLMAGKIDAKEQAAVTSKIAAKVAQINVDVGSQVKKGDVIITLDTSELQSQVNQAEASVMYAQASLENTLAGSRPEQITQARAILDNYKKTYETAKNNYDRMQKLYEANGVSYQQLESAQTQMVTSKAQCDSQQAQLDLLKNGATKETVNMVRRQVQQAKATVQIYKTQLSNGTITAPISGTVTIKNINVGELASPGMMLVSIVNTGNLYVNAYLPARQIQKVKQGQPVIVRVSELPGKKYVGEIAVVDAAINSLSKNVLVKVAIKNPDVALRPGMYAEIALKK